MVKENQKFIVKYGLIILVDFLIINQIETYLKIYKKIRLSDFWYIYKRVEKTFFDQDRSHSSKRKLFDK